MQGTRAPALSDAVHQLLPRDWRAANHLSVGTLISRPDSRVAAYAVPTNDNLVIARGVRDVLGP